MNLYERRIIMKTKIIIILLVTMMSLPASVEAAIVTFHTTAPTPGPFDEYNLVGATRDANNVGTTPYDSWLNDEWTYVALDRAAVGQTFVTGSSEVVYLCTGLWIQHAGYTENTSSGTNNNGTHHSVPANAKFGIRITDPSASGTDAFVLSSETYTVTGNEENIIPGGSSTNGTGTWIHMELTTPIALAPGTTYGFDVVSMSGNPNMYFETLGIKDDAPNGNPYTEGTAYRSGGNGVANNILTVAPGDRVFVVELAGTFPITASIPEPADKIAGVLTDLTLSWNPGRESTESKVYFGTNAASLELITTVTHTQDVDRYSFNVTGLDYSQKYYWRVDEVQQSGPDVRGNLWSFTTGTIKASDASPYDNEIAVFIDTDLSWKAGLGSTESKVYFGTSSDTLELQTTITHTEDAEQYSYQVTGLANNADYYWRVDETLDTGEEVTGDVWQFTTIPVIPVTDPSLVGWWKFDEGQGKAIDWSGLNQHGVVYGGAESVYGYDGYAINFDYADDYVELPIGQTISTLSSATITTWVKFPNIGETLQRILNFGNNDMTVFMYLTANNGSGALSFQITNNGGGTGATIDTSTELSGGWDHVAVVIDDTNMIVTIYVNGNIVSSGATQLLPSDLGNTTTNWLGRSQDGAVPPDPYFMGALDDLRIYNYALTADEIELVMKIDPLRAKDPNPAHGAMAQIESALPISWSAGDDAAQHDVYFGTDQYAVQNADTSMTDIYRGRQAGTSFTPSEGVEWGQRYYWRVDEVNNDSTISTGSIWTFEVADYLLVDDFEDYNDYSPDEVWNTWLDGYMDPTNGSTAGYPDPDFVLGEHYLDGTIVHEGSWSLPLFYNNDVGISEVTRTFTSTMRDWTRQDVAILTLFYYGDSANAAEPMYVALNGDAVVTNDVTNAALITEWIQWDILLQEFADLGVDLANVDSMSIGFGNKANPIAGGEGHVFFDDIRLYRLE
jgi:hypothetical protein